MDFFGILSMVGGLALFLYGMHLLGEGLSSVSGGRLEKILERMTNNPIKAVALGAGVTALIQSSSATTVMVVGFEMCIRDRDWYEQVMAGIRELIKDADKSQVAGISFGGQMHGLVILDKDDNVIRPAILWNDGRTTEECDYLNNVIGKDKLSQYTANISFTGFTAPKILWVKNKEDVYKRQVLIFLLAVWLHLSACAVRFIWTIMVEM